MLWICLIGWNLFITFPIFVYHSALACQPPPSATFAQPPILYDFDSGQQQQPYSYQYGVSPQEQSIQPPSYQSQALPPQFSGLINGVHVASPIVENDNHNVDLIEGSAGESDFSLPTTSSAFIQENANLPSFDDERVQVSIGEGVNTSLSVEAFPSNDGNVVAERWRANGAPTIPIVNSFQRNGFSVPSVADQPKQIVYPVGFEQANVAQVSPLAYYGVQNQRHPSAQNHPQLASIQHQPQLLPPTSQNPHLQAPLFSGGTFYFPPWQQQYGRRQLPANHQLPTSPLSFGGWNLYAQPNLVPPLQPTALWPQQQFLAQQGDIQQQQEVQPSVDNSDERSLETGNLSRVCPDASTANALVECLNIDDEPFQEGRSLDGGGEEEDDNDASMLLQRPLRRAPLSRCAFDTDVEPTCSFKSMANEAAQFYRSSLHRSGNGNGFVAHHLATFSKQFAHLMGRNFYNDSKSLIVPTGGFLLVLFDEPRVSGESVAANFEQQRKNWTSHQQPSRDAVLRAEIGGQRGDGTLSFKYWTNAPDRVSVKVCARMPFERHCTSDISYTPDTPHVDVQVVNPLPADRQHNGRFAVELIVSRRALDPSVTPNDDRQPLLFLLDDVQYDARYFEEQQRSPHTVGGAISSLSSLQLKRLKLLSLGGEARYHPVKVLSVGDVDVKSREEAWEQHRRARLLHAKQSSHRLGSIIPLSKDHHHDSNAMVEATATDEPPSITTSTKPTSFWQFKIRKLKTYSDAFPAKDADLSEDGPQKGVDLTPIEFAHKPVAVDSSTKSFANPLRYNPIEPITTIGTLSEVNSTISESTTSTFVPEVITFANEATSVGLPQNIVITTTAYTIDDITINNDAATVHDDVVLEPHHMTESLETFVPASSVTTSATTFPPHNSQEKILLNNATNDIALVKSSVPGNTVQKNDGWIPSEQRHPDAESHQMTACEVLNCDFVNSTCHYVQRNRRDSYANFGLKHGDWQLSRCTSGDEEPTADNAFVRCAMNRIGLLGRSDEVVDGNNENSADNNQRPRKSPILRHTENDNRGLVAALKVGHDDEWDNISSAGDAFKKRVSNVAWWRHKRRSSTIGSAVSRVGRVIYVLESAEFQLDEDGQLIFDLYKRSNAISLRVCLDAEQRKCIYESRELNARHCWRRGERVHIPKHARKIFFIATQWKRAKWLALANIRLERGSECTVTTTHRT